MKLATLSFAVVALSSATAFGAGPSPDGRPLTLAEVVSHMESSFHGQVVAVQFDASGDKRPHYHVDIKFPEYRLAKWDVDAVTLDIAARETSPLTSGSATLPEAAALIYANMPGQIIVAELDSSEDVPAHYDIDVRLPEGQIARLKVDPATRNIAWRNPPVALD